MTTTRLELDVSAVAPAGGRHVVADVVAPSHLGNPPLVACCLPGGGMSRRYFDLRVPPELGNYSMAAHLVARGTVVVLLDHLAVGESSQPDDGYQLTPHVVADVDAFALASILDGLRAGTVRSGLPPLPDLRPVGVGHSAGAMLTVHVQARHRLFDALALLGFGARGLPEHLGDDARRLADDPEALRRELPDLVRAQFDDPLPMLRRGSSDLLVGAPMLGPVHQALVDARANLLALVGLTSMVPGASGPELAAVDVPVFLGIGDRDLAAPAHEVPAAFPASRDVTLFVLADSGHNHNVAPTREQLWDRLGAWAHAVLAGPRTIATGHPPVDGREPPQ